MAGAVSAIFLDRDGTINLDSGYVYKIKDFKFIDGVIVAIQELKKQGFTLVVVTNQSGIARDMFSEQKFMRLMAWMTLSLVKSDIYLDGIYFCPHHPQATVEVFRQDCNCRKPKPGMLLEARHRLHIDMASSYMIGDKIDDMIAGKAAGVGTQVLIRNSTALKEQAGRTTADWTIDSLAALPSAIQQRKTSTSQEGIIE